MLPLSTEEQQEIVELSQRFGEPLQRKVAVCSNAFWSLYIDEKVREVCMIIRRKNGALLTFTKSFYPKGLYRLFSGGVEPNERVYDALMRELYEETNLEVDVQRFLAVVTCHANDHPTGTEGPVRFSSYVFLVQEVDGMLGVNDENECLSGYKDITIADLPAITQQLGTLPESVASELGGVLWSDWGRYRAVVSQIVYELLALN